MMAAVLQRKCGCGGTCGDCGDKRKRLQRSAIGPAPHVVPPIAHDVARSPGRPLDPASRAFFEPRFQHDFSRVRVHTDGRAAASADAVQARAYTLGSSIVFNSGAYAPHTGEGRRLLAHELTHVVQQHGEQIHRDALIGAADTPAERDADAAADRVAAGGFAHVARHSAGVMQRAMICARPLDVPGVGLFANHAYIDDTGGNNCRGAGMLRNYGLYPHEGSALSGCASKTDHSPDPCAHPPRMKPCRPKGGVTDVSACLRRAYDAYAQPSVYSNAGVVGGAASGLIGGLGLGLGIGAAVGGGIGALIGGVVGGITGLIAGAAAGGAVNGPNSNTFAATLAAACCEDASDSGLGWVPGWNHAPATTCTTPTGVANPRCGARAGAAGREGARR